MSISKRFRAGCLGLMLGTLGTPAIADPLPAAAESTPIVQLTQVTDTEASEPSEGDQGNAPLPAPSSPISVTTGEVQLLEAGQGPKSPLRLSPEAGSQTQLGADFTMKISMEMDGQAVPNPGIPPVTMILGMQVMEVDPAGRITYNITYDDIKLGNDTDFPESARSILDDVFQELKGLKVILVGDDRGHIIDARVEAPEDLNPFLTQMLESLSQSMKQVSAPLPEEAVGIGARWSITSSVTASGLTFEQTATYELVERDGDRFTVNMDVEQSANPQTIGTSDMGVKLTDYSATGNGNLVVDVGYPLPVSGLIDLTSITELSPTNLNQTMTSRADIRMELTPVTATP